MPFSITTAVELFQGISEAEAQRVEHLCTERKYRMGDTIFSKGDPGNALYIVKDGKVRILALSEKGTETIVHILKEGAIFGELLLSEEMRFFTAVAGTDAVVTVLPKGSMVELLTSIPTVSKNFIRLLSKRLARWRRSSEISDTPGRTTASRRSCSSSAKSTAGRPRREP